MTILPPVWPRSACFAPAAFRFCAGTRTYDAVCVVHGGAWDIPPALAQAHAQGVERAFCAIRDSLCGLTADPDGLVALLAGIDVLEDDPTFDAGHGSFLNEDGRVELDAGVMEGEGLLAGAVASLAAFAHPARVALDVLRKTEHVLLVGEGAARFASAQGHVCLDDSALVHPREVAAHAAWVAAGRPSARTFFSAPASGSSAGPEPQKRGTVGAVLALRDVSLARHARWSVFAATSTGGTPGKKVGRVGDVPIPGAGFYADDAGAAVSATGWGEAFLRCLPAKRASDLCALGASAQEAVEQALAEVLARTGGRGGLIAVSARGEVGAAFTTPDMAVRSPVVVEVAKPCQTPAFPTNPQERATL